jgi:hypothetical protein
MRRNRRQTTKENPVRKLGRCSAFIGLLFAASFVLAQSEFSADVVNQSEKGNKGLTKVYFGKDKMRFDSVGTSDQGGAVILDFASESFLVLIAKQHMYMEMPSTTMDNRGLFHFFRTGDIDNACSDWLKLEYNKGGSCHRVGSETVNGRSTVKYESTNSKGEAGTMWLDSKVRFPIKWEGKNGSGELRNIQEGPQPASLFQVPAGYTKMDVGGMMQQRH